MSIEIRGESSYRTNIQAELLLLDIDTLVLFRIIIFPSHFDQTFFPMSEPRHETTLVHKQQTYTYIQYKRFFTKIKANFSKGNKLRLRQYTLFLTMTG